MLQIGFDIGGTNIKAGVVDDNMKIIAKRNVSFPKNNGYEKTLDVMEELVHSMLQELHRDLSEIRAIGAAIPGSIDMEHGIIIDAYNLGFHDVPMKKALEKRFKGVRVDIANDADTAALAELHAGAFRGYRNAVLMTLGTGVGGGIILNGEMFNGGAGHGVELGHVTLIHGGPLCTCGNKGCIESVCTATWLTQQGRDDFKKNPGGLIAKRAKGDISRVNAKIVIDAAKEGDEAANSIFNKFIDYLSSAISSIIALLDPQIIGIGGGVSLAGDFLFKPLKMQVKEKAFFKEEHKIVPAQLGNDAGVVGAAMLHHGK